MNRLWNFLTLILLTSSVIQTNAQETSTSEILYSQSVLSGNYGHSFVSYSGFSWVENVKGRLPLSDSISFTPGRALSLKYTSSVRGYWEASIHYPSDQSYIPHLEKEYLSFYVYFMAGFDAAALPTLALLYADTCSQFVPLQNYTGDELLKTDRWFRVRVPLKDLIKSKSPVEVHGIRFAQGQPTGVNHANQFLIDQIEFAPVRPALTELNAPAVLNAVTAGPQHVELEWQLPLDPGIRFAKIYRSHDGENYQAVAMCRISALKYLDFVPDANRTFHYKITWIDYKYNESPFSEPSKIRVPSYSDEALLESIQSAHINYFNRHAEVNSGMHRVNLLTDDAVVDVGATGYSLIVQAVGTQRGMITPRMFLRRVANVVDFLLNTAEHYKGMYPERLDGRTGKGVFVSDTLSRVSLESSAALAQGLLLVRQYLDSFQQLKGLEEVFEAPRNSRGRGSRLAVTKSPLSGKEHLALLIQQIDSVWHRMEWNAFTTDGGMVLCEGWSKEGGLETTKLLGGFGKAVSIYLLASASPTFPIADQAYQEGLRFGRQLAPERQGEGEEENFTLNLTNRGPSFGIEAEEPDQEVSRYVLTPFRTDTLVYGCFLEVGSLEHSLMDAYQSFLVFDPRGKRDAFANYGEALIRLTEAYKRRDNELDAGSISADIWGSISTPSETNERLWLPNLYPALSISSLAFLPETGLQSMRAWYYELGPALMTNQGFRNWINPYKHQVSASIDPLHQAAVPIQIENYRSGFVWDTFMSHPDISRIVERLFAID